MQAIVVRQIGNFEWAERVVPTPARGEVLVRVALTGLCRTDLKLIEQGHRDLTLPRIPGEEVVGVICALGEGVEVSWMEQRVYLYPGISCGQCPACLRDAGNLCSQMRIMGFHRDGGFAEYVTTPLSSVIALPNDLNFETAIFAEPLSCCLNAIEKTTPSPGDRVLLYGAGPAGTLLARAFASLGCEVLVVEPDERRRKWIGGKSECLSGLFDIVVPAVGDPQVWDQALARLAPRGRLVAFSGLHRESSLRPLDVNQLHYCEQTLVGAYGCCYRHGVAALQWLSQGKICVDDLISDHLPLSELSAALQKVRDRSGMKILLNPSI